MMDQVVGHIVSRGVAAGRVAFTSVDKQPDHETLQLPAWGIVLLVSTAAVFIGLLSVVEYTCGRVIATLTMIESPSDALFQPLATDEPPIGLDNVKNGVHPIEPESLIAQQPITAKIRTTIRHLRSRAGFWSLFRGFSLYLVYGVFTTQLTLFISELIAMPRPIAGVIATVVFARLRLGWTHIVITEASPKPWFRRLPSLKLWKKVVLPTAVVAVCEQFAIGMPITLLQAMNLQQYESPDQAMSAKVIVKVIAILVLGLFTLIAIVIPASVTLVRVQASLLPESEETVIPFDRSFDGKVVPEIVGGSGMVSMLEAWKTFDRSARIRLFKLYVKVGALQLFTSILFTATLTAELYMIMGKDAIKQALSPNQF